MQTKTGSDCNFSLLIRSARMQPNDIDIKTIDKTTKTRQQQRQRRWRWRWRRRGKKEKQLFTRKTTLSFPYSVPTHLQLLQFNFYSNRHAITIQIYRSTQRTLYRVHFAFAENVNFSKVCHFNLFCLSTIHFPST